MPGPLLRRTLSVSGLLLAATTWWVALPLWLPGALLVDVLRPRRLAVTRAAAFLAVLLGYEVLGVLAAGGLFAVRPLLDGERWTTVHYRLQRWWATGLARAFLRLFHMSIARDGDVPDDGPALVLCRHASTPDTVLPLVGLAYPAGWWPRYVLKQELLWDPCLDVVGHRLPNVFVDRGARQRGEHRAEIRRIASLADGLSAGHCVILYPEGTRFTPGRKRRIVRSLRERDPDRAAWAATLCHTLPPRPGGVLALLDAAPHADVWILAHAGFEGTTRLSDLLDGSLVGSTVRLQAKRIPARAVPAGDAERLAWLDDHWERVDAWIDAQLS